MVAHKPYNVNRFIEKSNPKVFPCRGRRPRDPARYYYYPSTSDTTTSTTTKGSPKTFDAGVGIYAVTAILSVTGMAWTAKKRGN